MAGGGIVVKSPDGTQCRQIGIDNTGAIAVTSSPCIPLTLQSISAMSAMPGTLLTITGTGFDATASPLVQFTQSNGVSVQVSPVALTTTTVTVSVPPFVDANTGAFTSGTDSILVSQSEASGTVQSNTVNGLQIQALTVPPSAPGTLTLAYLQAERDFMMNTLESGVQGKIFDTAALDAALVNEVVALNTIIAGVQGVVSDPTQTYTIGIFDGQNVTIASSDLSVVDQALLGVLAAHASATFTTSSASRTFSANLPDPPACASTEAGTAYNYYATTPNPNDPDNLANYFRAAVAACAPQAILTAVEVVLGSAAVGIAVVAVGPEAAAIALARPAAILLGIALGAAGGEILVGGAQGQSTPGAVQLVQNGAKQLDEFIRDFLTKVFTSPAGTVLSRFGIDDLEKKIAALEGVTGALHLREAFFSAPPFNGGGTPSNTFKLQVTLRGNGDGQITSFPGSISCTIVGGITSGICSDIFPVGGKPVFLNPIGHLGSSFSGWDGACSGKGSCSITNNSNQDVAVGATFTKVSRVFTGTVQLMGVTSDSSANYNSTVNLNITFDISQDITGAITGTAFYSGNWTSTVVTCFQAAGCPNGSGDIGATANLFSGPGGVPILGGLAMFSGGDGVLFDSGMLSSGTVGPATVTGQISVGVPFFPGNTFFGPDLVQQITLKETP